MKVLVDNFKIAKLKPLIINHLNRDKYDIVKGIPMRKNRLDTVLTVNSAGDITDIKGINPNNNKIGDNIYNL